MVNSALREATPIDLDAALVESCLDLNKRPLDVVFHRAWTRSLDALATHERRGALAGVTGHVAESVVELLLNDLGYHALWHFIGPGAGGHGVDLLMASPALDHVLAIEVKGTLRSRSVPRMSRPAAQQMSAVWVDKRDNPGMAEWDLQSTDIYGAVIAVNFADMTVRAIATVDFNRWRSVTSLEHLAAIADA